MARDDMFSWLTQGKKLNKNATSPQDAAQQELTSPQEEGSTTHSSDQTVYFKQSPVPEIGENVSAIVSGWVNTDSDTCDRPPVGPAASEPQDIELREPQEPVSQETEPIEPPSTSAKHDQEKQFIPVSPSVMAPELIPSEVPKRAEPEPQQDSGFLQKPDDQPDDQLDVHEVKETPPAPEIDTSTTDVELTQAKPETVSETEDSAASAVPDELLLPINEHQRILDVLTKVRKEPKPLAGMPSLELAPPRLRRARVIAVKAGGRRVMARIQDIDRIYAYTLRPDKSYRLEGVATKKAPRLILDVEV